MYFLSHRSQMCRFELIFQRGGKDPAALGVPMAKEKDVSGGRKEGEGVPSHPADLNLLSTVGWICMGESVLQREVPNCSQLPKEDGSILEITREKLLTEISVVGEPRKLLPTKKNMRHIYFGAIAQFKLCQFSAAQFKHPIPCSMFQI